MTIYVSDVINCAMLFERRQGLMNGRAAEGYLVFTLFNRKLIPDFSVLIVSGVFQRSLIDFDSLIEVSLGILDNRIRLSGD